MNFDVEHNKEHQGLALGSSGERIGLSRAMVSVSRRIEAYETLAAAKEGWASVQRAADGASVVEADS